MNTQFAIDPELCIGCGECIADCPFGLLEMDEEIPTISKENMERCLQCQHCLTVCSTGALSVAGRQAAECAPLAGTFPTAQQMASLIKGRRSIRRYKQASISPEKIDFLLQTALHAPTAVNNRQVLFTVIDDVVVMEQMRGKVYAVLQEKIATNSMPAGMEHFKELVTMGLEGGQDAIFRGAPHLLIASSPKDSFSPDTDCLIALSYFELLAAAMGLGALWCGMAKVALTIIAPELLSAFAIPANHQIGYMLVFGRPDVKYHRTIQLDKVPINRVQPLTA